MIVAELLSMKLYTFVLNILYDSCMNSEVLQSSDSINGTWFFSNQLIKKKKKKKKNNLKTEMITFYCM